MGGNLGSPRAERLEPSRPGGGREAGLGSTCPRLRPAQDSRVNPLPPQIRTLRLKILAEAAAEGVPVRGARNQLRMYLTMAVAAAQPLLMYWLTFHLVR